MTRLALRSQEPKIILHGSGNTETMMFVHSSVCLESKIILHGSGNTETDVCSLICMSRAKDYTAWLR